MHQTQRFNLHKRSFLIIAGLLILTPFVIALGVSVGSVPFDGAMWISFFTNNESGIFNQIVFDLRLPRTLSAMITGGLLALAGVLMQVLLRNPLADPYILGISGGAAVATLLAILLGVGGVFLTSGAFAGALLSMFIVFSLSHGSGSWTPTRLLLTGVVVAAGWGAIISFILSVSPQQHLRGMLFWLMGDLGYAPDPVLGLWILIIGVGCALWLSRPLNVLARGDFTAQSLGINVPRLRILIYILASMLTATAVTIAGSIGFVGLITPHILRLAGVQDHRFLIPGSVLFGGTLLVLADTFSRVVIAPQQLPVGVTTTLLGVPLFLYLMQKSARQP